MQNNEYLSEERYQRNNSTVKKIGIVLLIIGVITLVVGIILLVVGFMGVGNSTKTGFNTMNNEMTNGFPSFDSVDTTVVQNTANSAFGSVGLFGLGGFILVIGFGLIAVGGGMIFMAHRREIMAYTTQQVMPVAQEGIEKMTPTVGKAVGSIGKELAKGINEGINEANNENDDQ